MSKWSLAQRLIVIGPTVILAGAVLGFCFTVIGRSTSTITLDSIIDIAIPLSVLLALSGVLLTLMGAVVCAFRLPVLTLACIGGVLVAVGVLCIVVVNSMQFGFDDPSLLYAQASFSLLVPSDVKY